MNRILVIVGVVLLFILGVSSCKIADSAEVALVVNQIGNDKGVPNIEMASGLIMYFPPTQDVYMYPTSVQHKVWTASVDEDSPTEQYSSVLFKSFSLLTKKQLLKMTGKKYKNKRGATLL